MNELAARKCKPCEGGTAPLTHTQAQQLLGQLSSAWVLTENAHAIRREFGFRDFYRTMSFVNALAHIANIEDHHPDRPGRAEKRLGVRREGGPAPERRRGRPRPPLSPPSPPSGGAGGRPADRAGQGPAARASKRAHGRSCACGSNPISRAPGHA